MIAAFAQAKPPPPLSPRPQVPPGSAGPRAGKRPRTWAAARGWSLQLALPCARNDRASLMWRETRYEVSRSNRINTQKDQLESTLFQESESGSRPPESEPATNSGAQARPAFNCCLNMDPSRKGSPFSKWINSHSENTKKQTGARSTCRARCTRGHAEQVAQENRRSNLHQ